MPRIDLEEVQQRINQNLPQPNEPRQSERLSGSESLPSNHPLWALWSRFNEIYGHQWASQQGDEPNDTWIRGLDGITNEQFGVGIRALLNRTETWPPNLVEFRQLCTEYDPGAWERQAHKVIDTTVKLEDKTTKERNLEERKAALAKMRAEVGL